MFEKREKWKGMGMGQARWEFLKRWGGGVRNRGVG